MSILFYFFFVNYQSFFETDRVFCHDTRILYEIFFVLSTPYIIFVKHLQLLTFSSHYIIAFDVCPILGAPLARVRACVFILGWVWRGGRTSGARENERSAGAPPRRARRAQLSEAAEGGGAGREAPRHERRNGASPRGYDEFSKL